MTLHRRDVLKTAAAVPLAAVAGCTGVLGDGEKPSYSDSTPGDGANDDAGVFFVHIDAEWLRAYDGEEELPYAEEFPDAVDIDVGSDSAPVEVDPLVGYPTAGLLIGSIGLGFGLLPYGFADRLLGPLGEEELGEETSENDTESATETDAAGSDVRVDSMLLVDGVGVFRGSFEADTIVAASEGFEPDGERNGFDIYEGTGEGFLSTEGLAFAVREDALVTLLDGESDLDAVLDTIAGETERLADDDDGGWALETAGHGHVTLGAWGIDPEAGETAGGEADTDQFVESGPVLESASGVVSSVTLGPEEGTASLAAVYPEGETPDRAAIENEVGTSATTRDVSIDGTRVAIDGTWRVAEESTPAGSGG
ncbi:hypothetical protein [Natronomonas amylolytica]|uniref:hypothetical protein n=1 Tax=Natronomonas amylolytica TaxID=3108498 RepID=UPI00300A6C95